MTEPAGKVTVLDNDWPGRALRVMPGDLSQWLPQGLGLGAPPIVTPYTDGPEPSFYGLDAPGSDPILAAPTQMPGGGVIYFNDGVDPAMLRTALGVMQIRLAPTTYVAFAKESGDTVRDRYLDQVRIVSTGALAELFGARREATALPKEPVAVLDYIETFIAEQKAKWNHEHYAFSPALSGTLGGDGDWAKESLGFGFAVENTYWGVYRLWSRPWLCTK